MNDPKDGSSGGPVIASDAGLGLGVRVAPQVLAFMATFLVLYVVAQGAVVAFVHAYWDDSFRQVAFVMDEWRPNDGSPYIAGHLDGSGEPAPFGLPGRVVDGRRVLLEAPSIAYETGARVPVWYSPEAPLLAYGDQWTNAVPVAALPKRPGWGRFAAHAAASIAVLVFGLWGTLRVARLGWRG